MGKLAELMQVRVRMPLGTGPTQQPDDATAAISFDNMLNELGGVPYSQLSVLLAHLRFLAMLHQTHHWTAQGDPFYGDHLLFERLYNAVVGEVDAVAEKAVGLGTAQNVELQSQARYLLKLVQQHAMQPAVPSAADLARRSLVAEVAFVRIVDAVIEQLDASGTLTHGLENMLQGIADVHEGHVYLLKQRCNGLQAGL